MCCHNMMIHGVIHKYAPFKNHAIVLHPTVPWFTDEISEAKYVLHPTNCLSTYMTPEIKPESSY